MHQLTPSTAPNAIANLKAKFKSFLKGDKKTKTTEAKPAAAAAAAPAAVAATATTDDKPTETAPVAAAPADTGMWIQIRRTILAISWRSEDI